MTPPRKKGRPALGPETRCAFCSRDRSRWLYHGGKRDPACTSCYNRERYEPSRRRAMRKTAKVSLDAYNPAVAGKAADMLRRGADWGTVCERTGLSQRTLLLWMGRRAAAESY